MKHLLHLKEVLKALAITVVFSIVIIGPIGLLLFYIPQVTGSKSTIFITGPIAVLLTLSIGYAMSKPRTK